MAYGEYVPEDKRRIYNMANDWKFEVNMKYEEILNKEQKQIADDLYSFIATAKYDATTQEVALPEYIQLELDFMDEMFDRRMEDPRA